MLDQLSSNPLLFFVNVIALIIAIAIHEFAHAITADHLGDPTPRMQGRVTLNPKAHIDMYGMLFLLLAGFGWGKPVQFDPFNLRNPRRDAAIISIAGPISNFLLATLCSIILRLLIFFQVDQTLIIGQYVLLPLIGINIILGVFNLLPIHPLDGFKIVGGMLPRDKAHDWYQLERYGFIFLIMLIIPFGGRSMISSILGPALDFLFPLFIP